MSLWTGEAKRLLLAIISPEGKTEGTWRPKLFGTLMSSFLVAFERTQGLKILSDNGSQPTAMIVLWLLVA